MRGKRVGLVISLRNQKTAFVSGESRKETRDGEIPLFLTKKRSESSEKGFIYGKHVDDIRQQGREKKGRANGTPRQRHALEEGWKAHKVSQRSLLARKELAKKGDANRREKRAPVRLDEMHGAEEPQRSEGVGKCSPQPLAEKKGGKSSVGGVGRGKCILCTSEGSCMTHHQKVGK